MTLQATSTTILIIPLILNTLSAPPPQTRAPMPNAPEIVYRIADLGSDQSAGNPSWLPQDICNGHFGLANTTDDSSVLLLLLVSLPSQQDQPTTTGAPLWNYRSNNSTKVNNRTAPWTSLLLEPAGIYGSPKSTEESVCSYPFGLNVSLDVGLFTLSDPSVLPMPPTIEIQDRQINDHPARPPPAAFFGFVLCSGDDNGSFVPSIFQDGRRYTREVPRHRNSVGAAQPRKLLGGAHGTNLRCNHRRLLICKKGAVAAAGIAIGSALLALLCSIAGLLYWCTRMLLEDERPIQPAGLCPSGPRRYRHHELVAAAHGFVEEQKIGRGGFGPVYRGFLADQERHVAIKVMSQGSSVQAQGMREFQAEVKVMTRLRHRNIVQLLGWCDGQGCLMLVYEFLHNGSLDKLLYGSEKLLTWSDRYKIALDVGSAILYLHTECDQCVLHGDIKPANILLDHSCNAKLGDFGLARLVDHGTDSRTTQVVAGTPGYMDPELVNNQRPCAESDIFSFGVVLLEIACSRRPTTQSNGTPMLVQWVGDMYNKNCILAAADRRLDGEFDNQQMRRVLVAGLWCTHLDQTQRPSIVQAMDLLRRREAELPVLDLVMLHRPDAVRSLEEIAYGDLSADASVLEDSSTGTAYHTSTDSSRLLE